MDKQLLDNISAGLSLNAGGSTREAALAVLKARHLLDNYNEAMVFDLEMVREVSLARSPKFPDWVKQLFTLVSKAFDVDYHVDEYSDHEELVVIGMEMDVEVCKLVFTFFRSTINAQLKEMLKNNHFNNKKDFAAYAAATLESMHARISMESRTRYAAIAAQKKDLINLYLRKNT